MIVTVTGATGFIGRKLIAELSAQGHQVNALVRNTQSRLGPAIATQAWDSLRDPAPELSLREVGAIVHLAGEPIAQRWTTESKQRMWDSRVTGTRNLVAAIERLPEAKRPKALIAASAIGIYGSRGDEVLTETSAPSTGFLPDMCVAWEREADRAAALGVRVVKLRIGIVLGRDGGALKTMLPPFRWGVGGKLGSGRQWMAWIHLDDIVGLLHHLIDHEASGVWNGVAPNAVTNAEFTRTLGAALGRPAILPVPSIALRLLFGEMASVILASQRVAPAAAEAAGFVFRHPRLAGALSVILPD